jgi:hypothetical protein
MSESFTGVTLLNVILGPKRLELLHEMLPGAAIIAVFVNHNSPADAQEPMESEHWHSCRQAKPEHYLAMIAAFAVCHEPEPGVLGEPLSVNSMHLPLVATWSETLEINMFLNCAPKLPKIILGVRFTDGIEVVRAQAQAAAA